MPWIISIKHSILFFSSNKNTKKENGPSDMFDGPFIYMGII